MPRALPLRLRLAVAVIAVGLAGCETSIVIDTPELEPALVVYSFPQPDSAWTVRVSHTLPLTTQDAGVPQGEVRDARVRLFEGATLLDEFVFTIDEDGCADCVPPQGHYISPNDVRPVAGRTYRLEIAAPDLPPVTAEVALPLQPEVGDESAEVLPGPIGGSERRRVRFTLSDPPGADVYELALLRIETGDSCPDGFCGAFPVRYESSSPFLRDGYELLDVDVAIDESRSYGFAVFRDALFEGRRQPITLDVNVFGSAPGGRVSYALAVSRVSDAFARYQTSLSQQDVNEGNPFAEPTPLYSNVRGGHGVVAGSAVTVLPLQEPSPLRP